MTRPALLIACALALLGAAPAAAQTYPSKPIRIVVPFVAGGAVDLLARIMGQKLTESLGQTVLIEFVPAGTPREVIALLQREAAKALKLPDVRTRLDATANEIVGSTPDEFAVKYKSDMAQFAKVVNDAGIPLQD